VEGHLDLYQRSELGRWTQACNTPLQLVTLNPSFLLFVSFTYGSIDSLVITHFTLSHNPSIYLSIPSHCVFPVDIKYLICVYHPLISLNSSFQIHSWDKTKHTRSLTSLFLLNSSLAKSTVSFRELGSEIRRLPRRMVRHRERALERCRNCEGGNVSK
jgi:hypothetical protein